VQHSLRSSFLQFGFGSRVGLARLCFDVYLLYYIWFRLPDFIGFATLLPLVRVSCLLLYCPVRVVLTLLCGCWVRFLSSQLFVLFFILLYVSLLKKN
jgi:hypothetical protein